MKKMIFAWMILLACAAMGFAQEHGGHSAAPSHASPHAADPSPHPSVPEHPVWVRPTVITIAVMFLLAWVVGWFVRTMMPQEMPQTHAHDEHHGHKDPHGDIAHGGHDAHGHASHH